MNLNDLYVIGKHANVLAFSRVVREGESRQDDKAFFMRYGGYYDGKFQPPKYFESLERHPRTPEPTKDGRASTAAGAFQATGTTWGDFEKFVGHAMDFSRESQYLFYLWCLYRRGALNAVVAGRFEEACRLCKDEWTSLPGGDEENAATKHARETYLKYGGFLAGAGEDPDRLQADTIVPDDWRQHEHYGEAVAESTTNPVPSADEQEKHMAPFLAAAWPALVSAAPDLIRLISGSKRAEQNAVIAEKVGAVAMQVTGAINEQAAAQKIATDPVAAKAFRAEVAENFDQWMGMVSRFHAMDEASRDKARVFTMEYSRHPVAGKLVFPELLSLLFVVVAAVGGGFVLVDPFDRFNTEMQTAVVMLMLIGGWNGVKEFWFGSSMGSMRKDERNTTQTKE